MSAIEQVVAHYNTNRRQHLDVPEWGIDIEQEVDGKKTMVRQPLRVFWTLLTVDRRQTLFGAGRRSDVDTLVAMAEDETGAKLFGLADKPELMLNADAIVITRLVLKMVGSERLSEAMVEQAEKN